MDSRVVIIFPPYMNYTEGEVETNASAITVLFKGSSVALVVRGHWSDSKPLGQIRIRGDLE